jgi:hypothetical protein
VHPASSFLDALRADLADAGWHTLSLQMPILSPDVKLARNTRVPSPRPPRARIEAGLALISPTAA